MSVSIFISELSFPFIIMDESSQATEPDALLIFTKRPQKIIMLGDHRQLEPTVISQKAINMGLRNSLFKRLITSDFPGMKRIMLKIQYRMHRGLALFSNKRFYKNKLETYMTDQAENNLIDKHLQFKNKKMPARFFNVDDYESEQNYSFSNTSEAYLITDIVSLMLSKGIK